MIGSTIILGAALLFRVGPAVRASVTEWRAVLSGRLALATRMRTEVAAADQVETNARVLLAQMDSLAPRLVGAGRRGEGIAAFVALVELEAGRHRALVLSSRPEPDSTRVGQLERLTLRVELESDWDGLIETLRALEAGQPVVELRELRVHPGESGAGGPVEVLRAELLLSGWIAAEKAPS
jgi:hypothetical protein